MVQSTQALAWRGARAKAKHVGRGERPHEATKTDDDVKGVEFCVADDGDGDIARKKREKERDKKKKTQTYY